MRVVYTAKNYSGEMKKDEVEIKNERDLVTQLRAEGFILTSFKEIKDENNQVKIKLFNRLFSVSLKDKLMFTRNLGVMISSGLSLSRAIKNLELQTKNKRFAKILEEVYIDIQSGMTFADSLRKYPLVFNDLFVNMIRVGETSGNLEEVLSILAVQLEKEHDLNSKVKGAMTYPAVILVAMIGIMIIMLTYVLPKILSVFKDMDVTLPPTTRFVIALSDMFQKHGIIVGIVFILLIIFVKIFIQTKAGKKIIGFLAINLPVISPMVIKINSARFARIYSSLIKSGVSVIESLTILSETLTNYYYQNAFRQSIEQVQKGIPLSKVIESNKKIFPVLVYQMVEVGEETGKTEEILFKLAEFYEDEISQITKNLSSIIEPFLMILIGGAVGFFAISMLQPMYGLMENIK